MPWDQVTRTETNCYEAHSLSQLNTKIREDDPLDSNPRVLLCDQFRETTFSAIQGGIGIHSGDQKQCLPRNYQIHKLSGSLNVKYTYSVFDDTFCHSVYDVGKTGGKKK